MAERYIPEHRRTQFKAKGTFKPEELRRRREEQQIEIRKAKREDNLAKRRGIATGENRPGASLGAAPDSDDESAPTESQVRILCIHLYSFLLVCICPSEFAAPLPALFTAPRYSLFCLVVRLWMWGMGNYLAVEPTPQRLARLLSRRPLR